MDKFLNKSFDDKFLQISLLRYLPWVGKNYTKQEDNHKVLIVAESVYDWNEGSETSKRFLKKKDCERIVVREHGLYFLDKATYEFEDSPTYRNLERVIYGKRDIPIENIKYLWLSVAHHQYVQRPMKNIEERPSTEDYVTGALVLKSVMSILRPHICIFLGTDWKKVEPILNLKYATYDEKFCYPPIGRSYPRVLNCKIDNKTSKIIMIQHTSKYFSWKNWHSKFLSKEAPEYIAYMKTFIKAL